MLRRPTAISLAIIEANRLVNDRTWVKVDATVENIVRLEWGTIHTNGMIERAIASRTYEQRKHMVQVGPVQAHA